MKLSEAAKAAIHELHVTGESASSIAAQVGCGIVSVYRILDPDYAERGRTYQRSYVKGKRVKFREFIQKAKTDKGCIDCGYNAHPAALDFDHLPGTEKRFTIGAFGSNYSRAALLEEMAKCEIVCANCHRIRTANRRDVRNDPI